jgi:hypothetical protein
MKRRKVTLRRSKKGIKRFRNILRGAIREILKPTTLSKNPWENYIFGVFFKKNSDGLSKISVVK